MEKMKFLSLIVNNNVRVPRNDIKCIINEYFVKTITTWTQNISKDVINELLAIEQKRFYYYHC